MKQLTEAQLRMLLESAYHAGYNNYSGLMPEDFDSAQSLCVATATREGKYFVEQRDAKINRIMLRC